MSRYLGIDIDKVLYDVCLDISIAAEYSPRGMAVKELIAPTVVITNPTRCFVCNPARKLKLKYIAAEMLWYFSGELSIDNIKDYASTWVSIAKDGKAHSNYGNMVFHQKLDNYSGNQFNWAVESLIKDKHSRQALINFNQPWHKIEGVADFPCAIAVQYFIRDDYLIAITHMRSNDLIYGFCNDFPFFSFLQQLLYIRLLKEYPTLCLGSNIHIANSLHVYEKHYDMMSKILDNYNMINQKDTVILLDLSTHSFDDIYSDIVNKTVHSNFVRQLYEIRDKNN